MDHFRSSSGQSTHHRIMSLGESAATVLEATAAAVRTLPLQVLVVDSGNGAERRLQREAENERAHLLRSLEEMVAHARRAHERGDHVEIRLEVYSW